MLMMTPAFRKKLNRSLVISEARRSAPAVTLPRVKMQRPKHNLTQAYRRKLIDQTAAILRRGEPTAFAFEGFMRHGLRSGLCRKGWGWREADETSAKIVSAALSQIGAKRPTYQQGQPEWTQEGVIMIEREYCVRCGWRLPEGCWKFCTKRCAWAHHAEIQYRFKAEQVEAVYDDAP